LSLCSGYEGIGLGLRRVLPNVREVAHVEIEAFAVANLVAKMEANQIHPAPVFTNLKEFPFGKFRGCVDIMSGGFPCQPFSAAGKKRGTEDPRHLFPYILEGIKQCRPAVVFLENVEGIISSKTADGESVLKYVLQSLEAVGYRATAGVFSASEVGAPHQRKRVFILANDDSQIRGRTSSEQQVKIKVEETTRRTPIGDGCDDAELADSYDERSQGFRTDSDTEGWEGQIEREARLCYRDTLWPACQNQQQYDWEEPRTVGNAISERLQGTPRKEQQAEADHETGEQSEQAEPIVGGATDGARSGMDPTANRVDRLRMLGNGVLPQVAAKAFLELHKRMV